MSYRIRYRLQRYPTIWLQCIQNRPWSWAPAEIRWRRKRLLAQYHSNCWQVLRSSASVCSRDFQIRQPPDQILVTRKVRRGRGNRPSHRVPNLSSSLYQLPVWCVYLLHFNRFQIIRAWLHHPWEKLRLRLPQWNKRCHLYRPFLQGRKAHFQCNHVRRADWNLHRLQGRCLLPFREPKGSWWRSCWLPQECAHDLHRLLRDLLDCQGCLYPVRRLLLRRILPQFPTRYCSWLLDCCWLEGRWRSSHQQRQIWCGSCWPLKRYKMVHLADQLRSLDRRLQNQMLGWKPAHAGDGRRKRNWVKHQGAGLGLGPQYEWRNHLPEYHGAQHWYLYFDPGGK